MRRFVIGVAVALSLAAVAAVAPAYGANASISVSPSTVSPGGTVHISGSIPVKKCPASDSATVTSEAALFPPDGFGPSASRDSNGQFALDYTVPTSTAPGTYSVGIRCGGGNVGVSASLTVAPAGGPATGAGGTAASSSSVWTAIGGACLVLAGLVLALRWRVARRKT
jgi:hypothetical protein